MHEKDFTPHHKNRAGFTLIELLVVIAIIGMLSSIVLASLNTARAKARDAKRLADFHQFDLAMAQYYTANGRYPTSPNTCCSRGSLDHKESFEAVAATLVSAGYLAAVPHDPNESAGWVYMLHDYGPGTVGQITVASLEGISPTHIPPLNSCRPFGVNWCSNLPQYASTAYCICHPY